MVGAVEWAFGCLVCRWPASGHFVGTSVGRRLAVLFVAAFLGFPVPGVAAQGPRVAVMPVATLADADSVGPTWMTRLEHDLKERFQVHLLPRPMVERLTTLACGPREAWWECYEEEESLAKVGKSAAADYVVGAKIAAMGDALVIKISLLHTATGTVSTEVIETSRQEQDTAKPTFLTLQDRKSATAPATARPKTVRYPEWLLWSTVGTVVAAAGTAAYFMLRNSDDDDGPGPRQEAEPWDMRRRLP